MTRTKNKPEEEGPWHIGAVRADDGAEVIRSGVEIRASKDASTRWYDAEVVWRCRLPISKDAIRMVEAGFWRRLYEDRMESLAARKSAQGGNQLRARLVKVSGNRKTGPIPVSTTSRESCPNSCPLYTGCYASGGPLRIHWDKVTSGEGSDSWENFCADVAKLPARTALAPQPGWRSSW